jgi:hypothetical protein
MNTIATSITPSAAYLIGLRNLAAVVAGVIQHGAGAIHLGHNIIFVILAEAKLH